MDDEPEVIRQQMDETRTALADKLGRLEQQVSDTVHSAVETVESVRTAATETVESVRNSVQNTVDSVKQSVRDTVETVTDTFDLELQVDRHPWTMVAGAAAVGFVGGYLYSSSRESSGIGSMGSYHSGESDSSRRDSSWSPSNWSGQQADSRHEGSKHDSSRHDGSRSATSSAFNWLAQQTSTLQPEMEKLKGLAIATAFGVLKDMLTQSLPKPLESQITEVVDGFTTSLGGKPIRGHVLNRDQNGQQRTGNQAASQSSPGYESSMAGA
jgi:ElaB/YqjD/DUF883 family membrane-anchored ribosome-binding protein